MQPQRLCAPGTRWTSTTLPHSSGPRRVSPMIPSFGVGRSGIFIPHLKHSYSCRSRSFHIAPAFVLWDLANLGMLVAVAVSLRAILLPGIHIWDLLLGLLGIFPHFRELLSGTGCDPASSLRRDGFSGDEAESRFLSRMLDGTRTVSLPTSDPASPGSRTLGSPENRAGLCFRDSCACHWSRR